MNTLLTTYTEARAFVDNTDGQGALEYLAILLVLAVPVVVIGFIIWLIVG